MGALIHLAAIVSGIYAACAVFLAIVYYALRVRQ